MTCGYSWIKEMGAAQRVGFRIMKQSLVQGGGFLGSACVSVSLFHAALFSPTHWVVLMAGVHRPGRRRRKGWEPPLRLQQQLGGGQEQVPSPPSLLPLTGLAAAEERVAFKGWEGEGSGPFFFSWRGQPVNSRGSVQGVLAARVRVLVRPWLR